MNNKDIFNQKELIANKLGEMIQESVYTKSRLSKESGVSRPTLDKLLSAQITNQTNFIKHLNKILNALKISIDDLLHKRMSTTMLTVKNYFDFNNETTSKNTGIPLETLNEIEDGIVKNQDDLINLATYIGTSTYAILGKQYFYPQSLYYEHYVNDIFFDDFIMGGYIGLLLEGQKDYLWYPITDINRPHFGNLLEIVLMNGETIPLYTPLDKNEFIVIPCLKNKLLLINKNNIKSIKYKSHDSFNNPDESIYPLSIYEIIEDYFKNNKTDYSKQITNQLNDFIKENNVTKNNVKQFTRDTTIYYYDGAIETNTLYMDMLGDVNYELINLIDIIYRYGSNDYEFKKFTQDLNYPNLSINYENLTNTYIDLNKVALIELPLVLIDNAISDLKENNKLISLQEKGGEDDES